MKARIAATRQIRTQLIAAPSSIRYKYRDMGSEKRLTVLVKHQLPTSRSAAAKHLAI